MAFLRRRILALLVVVTLVGAWPAYVPRGRPALAESVGPLTTTLAFPEPPLLATAAAVYDEDTGKWLRLYNADAQLPMASTTKIMTAILAIQHGHLNDLVHVSKAAASIGEATMGLVAGEHVSMTDLLYGLLIPSGNDAAIAIAEHVSGSLPRFVDLMNARARQLHLTHTHYVTPYGFSKSADGDDPAHYTSARDLVTLALYAMRSPLFRKIVGTQRYVVSKTTHNREHDLVTVDYFIKWYPGADGVKPGWTSGAGICQVIDAKRDGRHVIAAVLHTPNVFTDARDLMNYALRDFTWAPSGYVGDTPDQVVFSGTPSNPVWYFPYSGHSIRGAFLTYFKRHGGYLGLGVPETETVEIDGMETQFFSAQQLVYNPAAHVASSLHLGLAAAPGPDWLRPVAKVKTSPSTRYYAQTGHTVTNRFLAYYLAHGGPATFGYPITEKREEKGRLVQYFENAELEWSAKPDDLVGYVYAGPLGIRSLVSRGLILGNNLPPALHAPFAFPSATPSHGIVPLPDATLATSHPTASPRVTMTPYVIHRLEPSQTPIGLPTSSPSRTALPYDASTASPTAELQPTREPSSSPTVRTSPTAPPSSSPTVSAPPTAMPSASPTVEERPTTSSTPSPTARMVAPSRTATQKLSPTSTATPTKILTPTRTATVPAAADTPVLPLSAVSGRVEGHSLLIA
jgi:D-alanyl-D-alanine carboxypeptidase